MLNQIVCVGRITEIGNETLEIVIPRPYKNEEGIYENDYVKFIVKGALFDNIKQYCNTGDVAGVKGRIESKEDKSIQLIAEKVTFLAPAKKDNSDEDTTGNTQE